MFDRIAILVMLFAGYLLFRCLECITTDNQERVRYKPMLIAALGATVFVLSGCMDMSVKANDNWRQIQREQHWRNDDNPERLRENQEHYDSLRRNG